MKARKIIKSILEENAIDAKRIICEDLALKLGQRLSEEYRDIAKTYFSEENGGGDGGGGESSQGGEESEGGYEDQNEVGGARLNSLIALFMKRGMPKKKAVAKATQIMNEQGKGKQ